MRILLLSAASSVHTVRWANAMAARGNEIHLVTQHAPAPELLPAIRVHRLPHLGGLGYVFNGPRFARLVRRIAPDIVNAHYATGYGTLAGWCGSVPLVLNVWGSDVYDFPEKSPMHRWLVVRNLRRANIIVSTSEAMADRTRVILPELKHLDVVPFGVDTSVFKPAAKNTGHHAGLVIGTVKALFPKYGVDTLIEAFALVTADRAHDLRLRIVGGGPQLDDLKALTVKLGIADRTEFTGAVPHARVADELRGLDVFVALSRWNSESFGVAVVEASACGLPVVVSNAGGLPEVVADGTTGIVVPCDDPVAAAAAIGRFIASAELRSQAGAAGVARVAERYEWSTCVDLMLQVLERARANRARA